MSQTSVLEKVKNIEVNFNENYLIMLFQMKSLVEGEPDEEDVEQFELLEQSYVNWHRKLQFQPDLPLHDEHQGNPRSMDACNAFYASVKEYHDLLLARDEQLFWIDYQDPKTKKVSKRDFLSQMFLQKGIRTKYLYEMLDDGSDGGQDARALWWNNVIALYRLSVLICIYMQMPLVREIIDMILVQNPDINQANIFEKIMGQFTKSKRLRRMMLKLLKNKQNDFSDIFSNLQKVISTFTGEVNMDPTKMADMVKKQNQSIVANILTKAEVKVSDEVKEELVQGIVNKDQNILEKLIQSEKITEDEGQKLEEVMKEAEVKVQQHQLPADLGQTMQKMMSALQSGNEDEAKKILEQSAQGMNIDPSKMEEMTKEMEAMEKEFEEMEKEEDKSDDEDAEKTDC